MKVHLIDGTYELFRSYFGAPPATAPDGTEVGATRGLLRSFYAMLRRQDVTHVGVAYDHVIESFRNELFDGYKTGDGIEPDLWGQFPLAEQVAAALGIVSWPMVDFEADDALATAASRFADDPRVTQVVICTPDKDLAQCVRADRVVLWGRKDDTWLDEVGVNEKFGVAPASIPHWLGLVGDSADGIPGIPRWGKKSAATVLQRYQTVDGIPRSAEDWDIKVRGAAGLSEQLEAARGEAGLFVELATLRTDAPVPQSLAQMEWRGVDHLRLEDLCHRIGDQRFLDRLARDDQ